MPWRDKPCKAIHLVYLLRTGENIQAFPPLRDLQESVMCEALQRVQRHGCIHQLGGGHSYVLYTNLIMVETPMQVVYMHCIGYMSSLRRCFNAWHIGYKAKQVRQHALLAVSILHLQSVVPMLLFENNTVVVGRQSALECSKYIAGCATESCTDTP